MSTRDHCAGCGELTIVGDEGPVDRVYHQDDSCPSFDTEMKKEGRIKHDKRVVVGKLGVFTVFYRLPAEGAKA